MYLCKMVKETDAKIKVFFDDFLMFEEALKVEITDIESKIKEFEKG